MERLEILEAMVKDALDAVEANFGRDGLSTVVQHMKRANEARETNAEIDELETVLAGWLIGARK